MSIKTVASFHILMSLAAELGAAKKSGDPTRIKQAVEAHDAYKEICLAADELMLHKTLGEL